MPSKSEMTGDFKMPALAGIFALAAFAKAMNIEDILRLPQQLKSIKGMATFAKGIGTITTLGFGAKLVDDFKIATKAFGTNLTNGFKTSISGPILSKFDDFKAKHLPKAPFAGIKLLLDDNLIKPVKSFFSSPGIMKITSSIDEFSEKIYKY